MTRANRFSKGFSLIEVLVSLLILGVGLLGVAGLQLSGFKYSHSSYERTQASILIADLVDRMRANPDGVAGYLGTVTAVPGAPGADCSAAACTPTQLATYDVFDWTSNAANRVAFGSLNVQQTAAATATTPATYRVTLNWSDRVVKGDGSGDQDIAQTLAVTVQL